MPVHLVKLAFKTPSPQHLRDRIAAAAAAAGVPARSVLHVTRTVPAKAAEIAGEGSIYWITKGQISCRQRIQEIREVQGPDGKKQCHLVLDAEVVDVQPRPRKAFLGWRYLPDTEAPPDLSSGDSQGLAEMPPEMRRELMELGLL